MKKMLPAFLVCFCSVAYGQTGSDIYLFNLKIKEGQVFLSDGVNITNHKGYDNQPFFHPFKPIIYYSSFDDSSRSDIKYYNYQTRETFNLTLTHEREYSPTVTPDLKFISCIIQRDNGVQDLGRYPIGGGEPGVIINTLKVGYQAWADKDKLLLFVLVDSTTNHLHYYNVTTKADTVIAINPGRSLCKIPGQNAMSFIQKNPGKDWLIQRFDLGTGAISTLAHTLPGQENMCWLEKDIILMSEGTKLFSYRVGSDKDWQPIIMEGDTFIQKGFSRLAVDTRNTKLAVVISE